MYEVTCDRSSSGRFGGGDRTDGIVNICSRELLRTAPRGSGKSWPVFSTNKRDHTKASSCRNVDLAVRFALVKLKKDLLHCGRWKGFHWRKMGLQQC